MRESFINNFADFRSAALFKKESNIGIFFWIMQNILRKIYFV